MIKRIFEIVIANLITLGIVTAIVIGFLIFFSSILINYILPAIIQTPII